jgi:CRISPR type III-associated protein (TIGR04423 family)
MSNTKANSREAKKRIPAGNYEGYLWFSDEQAPHIFHPTDDFTDDFSAKAIPFVVEGWLYDRANAVSYAIRYLDGKYLRTAYHLSASEERSIEYVAHDLKGVKTFRVVEHWAPEEDPYCAGMSVLRHAWTAFAGFASLNK